MNEQQFSILKDLISLVIFLIPVISLFWKVAKYSSNIDNALRQKDQEIYQLKNDIKDIENKNIEGYHKINMAILDISDRSGKTNDQLIQHTDTIGQHDNRIGALERRTEKISEDLTAIKTENSKQTAMLELLTKNIQ